MSTERSFEQAILDAPEDDARRLIYADWLEERGDPRGEYLRVETALAQTPLNDPRYRTLRERVAELRNAVDGAWGVAIGLRRIISIEDVVYYLREFHKGWSDSPGMDPASLPADLPYGLTLVYRELGALIDIEAERPPLGAQDHLVAPNRLRRVGDMMEFVWENQGNWSCRFPVEAGVADPPVYSDAADILEGPPRRGFQKVCDSLNHFLATFCLREAVFSSPCLVSFRGDCPPGDVLDAVPRRALWVGGQYVWAEPVTDFFDVPGRDVLLMEEPGLWLGSHRDAALKLIRSGVSYNRMD
jgi:uncharacterized protein (TIGR02996 family)